jgi:hypothetical protein
VGEYDGGEVVAVGETVVGAVDGAAVRGIDTTILHQRLQHPPPEDADIAVQALALTGNRDRALEHRSQYCTLAWHAELTSTLHSSKAVQPFETPYGPHCPITIVPVWSLQATEAGLIIGGPLGPVSVMVTRFASDRSTRAPRTSTTAKHQNKMRIAPEFQDLKCGVLGMFVSCVDKYAAMRRRHLRCIRLCLGSGGGGTSLGTWTLGTSSARAVLLMKDPRTEIHGACLQCV